jgi:outer membrane protein insertion porin family
VVRGARQPLMVLGLAFAWLVAFGLHPAHGQPIDRPDGGSVVAAPPPSEPTPPESGDAGVDPDAPSDFLDDPDRQRLESEVDPNTIPDEDPDADADSDADADPDADANPDSDVDSSALDDEDAIEGPDDGWGDPSVVDDDDESDEDVPRVRYFLEDVRIEGSTRTRPHLIRDYVPFERGDVIDPESDDLEAIAWGVRGTGWFSRVRIRLERGSQRGWVDLVIEVEDRNTVVVNQFLMGISEGLSSSRDVNADVLPYVGFSIAETNLLGSGNAITLTGLMSQTQQAVRVGYQAPQFLRSRYTLRLSTSFHSGREFYGNVSLFSASCPPGGPSGCIDELERHNVVVFYRRSSVAAGIGRTVGSSFHWGVDWVADVLNVSSIPDAASEVRGDAIVPIDFAVAPGRTLVSSLRASLVFDRRDDPNLTRRGVLVRVQGDVGSRLFGGRYDYSRLQTTVRGWIPLPRRQVLRLSMFAGIITGDAPFFTLFHVSDLTDLIPSRVLEMDIDRRGAPNLLGTSVSVMRAEEFAARADVQYEVALQRGAPRAALRGINGFANVGLYMLSDLSELSFPPSGFRGASRFPVDLTFDLGLRIDTDIGLFEIGFSNLLGFINLR